MGVAEMVLKKKFVSVTLAFVCNTNIYPKKKFCKPLFRLLLKYYLCLRLDRILMAEMICWPPFEVLVVDCSKLSFVDTNLLHPVYKCFYF